MINNIKSFCVVKENYSSESTGSVRSVTSDVTLK